MSNSSATPSSRLDFDGKAFGRRLAAAREWAGLAPKQLAELIGSSTEAIYRLERGDRQTPPRKAELKIMAEALAQPVEWLLHGDAPPWVSSSGIAQGKQPKAEGATSLHDLQERLQVEVDRLAKLNDLLETRLAAQAPSRRPGMQAES